MPLRYYLLLFFANPASDKTVPFGEDLGGASQELTDMVQHGGPDGIVGAMLVSNKKLIKVTPLKSKAWHIEQRDFVLSANDRAKAEADMNKRLELQRRFADLQAEAEELGMALPSATLVVSMDGLDENSPLTPIDMGDLMHGDPNGNTPPTPPMGAQDGAGQAPASNAPPTPPTPPAPPTPPTGAQDGAGQAPAVNVPPTPPAPATGAQGGAKGGSAKGKAGNAPKGGSDDAKPTEGAADGDSASKGDGTTGDLLEGA